MTGTEWTWHGGNLEAARRHYGDTEQGWVDLSTGINPNPWHDAEAMRDNWQRLPDTHALGALEEIAAHYFGVEPRYVCAVPGTEIGLRLIGHLIGGPAYHLLPCYRSHREMIDGSQPVLSLEEAGADMSLILANPNNPDGRLFPPEILSRRLSDQGRGWLLLDEAFIDVSPEHSLTPHIAEGQKLVIFRSFGKFFGLAGVRLGFVIGPSTILCPLRHLLGAWPLSNAALSVGIRAYQDDMWIAQTRKDLYSVSNDLNSLLNKHGFYSEGRCPLFHLITTPDAHSVFDRLARNGILARPFAEQPEWLRLGLPANAQEMKRLEQALENG